MADERTVHERMSDVMADIGVVSKGDFNNFHKFQFRGIDSVQSAVYGPMCKHGVFVTPEVVGYDFHSFEGKDNKVTHEARLLVNFHFHGADGDSVTTTTIGVAQDTQDKAANKAMAAAFKYALTQTFVIPTEGQDDADFHAPPEKKPNTSPPPAKKAANKSGPEQPTQTKADTAPSAEKMEQLHALWGSAPESKRPGWEAVAKFAKQGQEQYDKAVAKIEEMMGDE